SDVLQVPPDQAFLKIDHADRWLADFAIGAGVRPFANDDHRIAFAHQPLDLKGDIRGARHRLPAQEDESVATEDRVRYARRPVDDVGMQPFSQAFPVPRLQGVQGAHHDVRSRAHDRWKKRCRAKSRTPTTAVPTAATSTAAAATSLALPIIGWRSGQA